MDETDIFGERILKNINASTLCLKVKCVCPFGAIFEFLIIMINLGKWDAIITEHLLRLQKSSGAELN